MLALSRARPVWLGMHWNLPSAGHALDMTAHPLDTLDLGWTRTGCPVRQSEVL